jgi:predicted Zn-dependent protease
MDVVNFLAYLYAEENVKLDFAQELLERALKESPDNPYYLDSLGWVFYRQGKADKAIDYIQRAVLGMQSDDAILRDHLGDAYLLGGEPEKAVAEWKRARRLDSTLEGVQSKIDKHK